MKIDKTRAISERRLRAAVVLTFLIGVAVVACRRQEGPRSAALFQSHLQNALQSGELASCPVSLATEVHKAKDQRLEVRHIKIILKTPAQLQAAQDLVESAARETEMSVKKWTTSPQGGGYVLYEVGDGTTRLASVLLMIPPVPEQIPTRLPIEEPPSKVISLPKYFRGDYKISIIIDDMGADWHAAEALSRLPEPLTWSIFPEEKYSQETARLAQTSGKEVMVHLPLEPEAREGLTLRPKTILTSMSPQEVESIFNEDLKSVPHAVGINNHMGSRATTDRSLMREILTLARMHSLFFIDSRTTPETQAYLVAKELGVPTNFRSVFLDDRQDLRYTEHQLDVLLQRMLKQGSAIAIGHPFPTTIEALRRRLPEFERRGVHIVLVSQLVS
ncbi:MAG: divergent polysaccharide deacetylase family protein [Acidobacteriia bacterium]|nr:divergent polysaccharide deacetylase family protein [Terriglobia bacterium]